MNSLALVIHTANILGIFSDPFEFQGDYGPEMNPVRQSVFELIMSQEALARTMTDSEIRQRMQKPEASATEIKKFKAVLIQQAREDEEAYGPTLGDLIDGELLTEISRKQREMENLGFRANDLKALMSFLDKYKDQKVFRFLRNNPHELMALDKPLRDQAARLGKNFDLPVLSSVGKFNGNDAKALKKNLLDILFTAEIFNLTKPDTALNAIKKLDAGYLKQYLGEGALNNDLEAFCTPAGQVFFYWMYQALNVHLLSEKVGLIEQVNKVKEIFAKTLGNPEARAHKFREKVLAANSGVVFTQESDAIVPQLLAENNLFYPVDGQNPQDGCFVFMRQDLWEPEFQFIPIDNYPGYHNGVINVILATSKVTGQKFLLAACHGHSTKPEDGRLQISLVMEKFHQLRQKKGNDGLQLIIGIDANTKSEEDVRHLHMHLEELGLTGTRVGPTTIKQRMVTVQHSKMGRRAVDEEDYLITLTPEGGGHFVLTNPTIGFSEKKPDPTVTLPNLENPSDHYAVGATLQKN